MRSSSAKFRSTSGCVDAPPVVKKTAYHEHIDDGHREHDEQLDTRPKIHPLEVVFLDAAVSQLDCRKLTLYLNGTLQVSFNVVRGILQHNECSLRGYYRVHHMCNIWSTGLHDVCSITSLNG